MRLNVQGERPEQRERQVSRLSGAAACPEEGMLGAGARHSAQALCQGWAGCDPVCGRSLGAEPKRDTPDLRFIGCRTLPVAGA